MKRIALLIPNTDTVLETDLQRFLPDDIIIHTARMWLDEVGEKAEKRMVNSELPKGIKKLKDITNFDLAIFGCTSASAIYGPKGLKEIENFISTELECPSISAFGAILTELQALEASEVAILAPYTKDVLGVMSKTLQEFGITVKFSKGLDLLDDIECGFVEPIEILELARKYKVNIKNNSNILFLSCTNFRSHEIRNKIEEELGITTITSNTSILNWILANV